MKFMWKYVGFGKKNFLIIFNGKFFQDVASYSPFRL
jgi:hypothetical protein